MFNTSNEYQTEADLLRKIYKDGLSVEAEQRGKELRAIKTASMLLDPRCGNCKYHKLVAVFPTIQGYKCMNSQSPHKRTLTKDFITCDSWSIIEEQSEEEELNGQG